MATAHSSLFTDKTILAPMMTGSNRTFRRFAHRFGADILGGEMAHSAKIRKHDRRELALVSARHEDGFFSAQLCGCNANIMAEAAKVLADRGAKSIDINAGCPMHFVIQHGGGAALLETRTRLGRIVEALKAAVNLPVTVKIRAGFSSKRGSQVAEIAGAVEQAGADALAVHARFRDQYYETAANWNFIAEAVKATSLPVIGNGDIRSWQDAVAMREQTGCSSVMVGRAALQRPWIFQEIRDQKTLDVPIDQRWTLIEEHFAMLRETFGTRAAFEAMRWHAGWYLRWHPQQKENRERWATMTEDQIDAWTEEVRQITLAGPEILPTPALKHDAVEAG